MKWKMDQQPATRIAVAMFVCAAAWAVPTPLSSQTPRERADSLQGLVTARETPDKERPRLWLLTLAAWYEEGARALLVGDRDRLEYASEQETKALPVSYYWVGNVCSGGVPIPDSRILSYLSYTLGHWHGQGRVPGNASELADRLLERADGYRALSGKLRDC